MSENEINQAVRQSDQGTEFGEGGPNLSEWTVKIDDDGTIGNEEDGPNRRLIADPDLGSFTEMASAHRALTAWMKKFYPDGMSSCAVADMQAAFSQRVKETTDEFDRIRRAKPLPLPEIYPRELRVSREQADYLHSQELDSDEEPEVTVEMGRIEFASMYRKLEDQGSVAFLGVEDALRHNLVVSDAAQPSKTADEMDDFLRSQMIHTGEPTLATEELLSKDQEDRRQAAFWSVAAGIPERPPFVQPTAEEEHAHWLAQKRWEEHPEEDRSDEDDDMPDLEDDDNRPCTLAEVEEMPYGGMEPQLIRLFGSNTRELYLAQKLRAAKLEDCEVYASDGSVLVVCSSATRADVEATADKILPLIDSAGHSHPITTVAVKWLEPVLISPSFAKRRYFQKRIVRTHSL